MDISSDPSDASRLALNYCIYLCGVAFDIH